MTTLDPHSADEMVAATASVRVHVDQVTRRAMRPAAAGVLLSGIGVVSAVWAYLAPGTGWLVQAGAIPVGAAVGYLLVRWALALDSWIGGEETP